MNITDLLLQVDIETLLSLWEANRSIISKFTMDIVITFIIIRGIYHQGKKQPEFLFTYFIFNILIFFLCHLMARVELGVGFAFGLFALFSIMRYRTRTVGIREMTFLFAVISVAVINAITGPETSLIELLIVNLALLASVYIAHRAYFSNPVETTIIIFDKIDLLHSSKRKALLEDLEMKIGHPIVSVKVLLLNYLTDSAELEVMYHPNISLESDQKGSDEKFEKIEDPISQIV